MDRRRRHDSGNNQSKSLVSAISLSSSSSIDDSSEVVCMSSSRLILHQLAFFEGEAEVPWEYDACTGRFGLCFPADSISIQASWKIISVEEYLESTSKTISPPPPTFLLASKWQYLSVRTKNLGNLNLRKKPFRNLSLRKKPFRAGRWMQASWCLPPKLLGSCSSDRSAYRIICEPPTNGEDENAFRARQPRIVSAVDIPKSIPIFSTPLLNRYNPNKHRVAQPPLNGSRVGPQFRWSLYGNTIMRETKSG